VNFDRNKLFIDVGVFQMVDIMTRMTLNRLSNAPNVGVGNWSCVKIPIAFFGLAFECITVRRDSGGDKFIDI